jgi:hypothetical protein
VRSSVALLLLVVLAFGYGLWRLFDLRFASGDIYPPYSSLRADPQGCRALYESLGELPGFTVERNYRPIEKINQGKETIFYLGNAAPAFEGTSEDDLKQFEKVASGGARLVIAFRSANADEVERERPVSTVEKRWGVKFTYVKLANPPDRANTALFLTGVDPRWSGRAILERSFGAGSVVLVPLGYPLSNEALQQGRDVDLLLRLIGDNRHVIFEESHLGVIESGSVSGLARKYRMEGVVMALLLLAGLFIWKNSTSLLPARDATSDEAIVASKYDSSSGLANLLRRNISPSRLLPTCLEEWEKAQHRGQAGMNYAETKRERVRLLATRGGDPVENYREISALLAEKRDER